jgi:beta-mannosidase
MHIWDVWNELDYTAYRRYVPRFVAEFGFQGPPTWATLHRAVHDDPLTPASPGVLQHQKADDGNGKLARGLDTHLPPPGSIDDWHWATSLNQARAVSLGVEHFRSWAPVCMGTVVWQLNDTWPAVSWAAIDGDGRLKPLWYALRRSYRDTMLTLQPRDGGLTLIAVNDAATPWRGEVTLSRRAADGVVLSTSSLPVDVAARCTVALVVPAEVAASGGGVGEFILAECGTERGWWHTEEDVDAKLPAPELTGRLEQTDDGYRLTVTVHTFVRDLALLVDRVAPDAVVDDMLVTLLPGERTVFAITTSTPLTLDQLTDPLVLRSANQLVAD